MYMVKIKVFPLQAMKTHGDVSSRFYTYTATALGRGRVASPTLGSLYHPGKAPGTHFVGGWVDSRTSLDTKEWRKSPPLRHPGSNPGHPSLSQAPCRLSYLVHNVVLYWGGGVVLLTILINVRPYFVLTNSLYQGWPTQNTPRASWDVDNLDRATLH